MKCNGVSSLRRVSICIKLAKLILSPIKWKPISSPLYLCFVLVNNAPSIPVCPPVAPRPTFSGNIGNFLSWEIGDCSDVEDIRIQPVCDPPSGSFFSVGSQLVTCNCTDSGGLSSQCTFTATVLSEGESNVTRPTFRLLTFLRMYPIMLHYLHGGFLGTLPVTQFFTFMY